LQPFLSKKEEGGALKIDEAFFKNGVQVGVAPSLKSRARAKVLFL